MIAGPFSITDGEHRSLVTGSLSWNADTPVPLMEKVCGGLNAAHALGVSTEWARVEGVLREATWIIANGWPRRQEEAAMEEWMTRRDRLEPLIDAALRGGEETHGS